VFSSGATITSPLVLVAIAQTGRILDPTVSKVGVTSFLNGLNTLTQGVDATITYPTDLGDMGLIDWTLAGNYNTTSVSKVAPTPAVFGGSSVSFFTQSALFDFVHSAPQEKVALTANWSLDEFGLTFRETYWGPQKNLTSQDGSPPYFPDGSAGVGLTDIEGRYNITEQLQFALGANNIFNIHPGVVPFDSVNGGPADGGAVLNDPVGTSWNPNGGYYYARVTFNF
jgi:iron complex outermembrane receptor protein